MSEVFIKCNMSKAILVYYLTKKEKNHFFFVDNDQKIVLYSVPLKSNQNAHLLKVHGGKCWLR